MSFAPLPVEAFLDRLAGSEPTPGGGTAAALAGATACALAEMVLGLTLGKEKFKEAEPVLAPLLPDARALREEFLRLADEDSRAYEGFVAAMRLPKGSDAEKVARAAAMRRAALGAAQVPLRTAQAGVEALRILGLAARHGNPGARSDATVGALHAWAAVQGARLNVLANLPALGDAARAEALAKDAEALARDADALLGQVRALG